MLGFIIRRLLQIIPTVFIAISFLFFLFFVLPGDPANLIVGGGERVVDPGVLARANERYGLDDPLWVQFKDYWVRLLHWDLGESFANRRSVNEILYERAPQHPSGDLGDADRDRVGISVGLISAVKRYSLTDKATTVFTTAAAAIPVFVLGFILQYVFAVIPNKRVAGVDGTAHVRPRPRHVVRLLHPRRRAVALPDPPGVTLAAVSTALAPG